MKGFIAIISCFILVVSLVAQSSKVDPKVKNLKSKLGEIKDKKEEARSKLKSIQKVMRSAKQELADVDEKMEGIEAKVHATQDRLTRLDEEHSRLNQELEKASKEFEEKSKRAKQRLLYIRMKGETSVIAALTGATSLSDLTGRKFIFETIASKDRKLFSDVKELRDSIARKRDRTKQIIAENKELLAVQRQQHAQWNESRKEKSTIVHRLMDKASSVQELLSDLNQDEQRIENQIQKYLEQTGVGGARPGKLLMPVSGRLSSKFGMRNHPILRRSRMHTGQDIAAPSGTSIKAAAAGTVITSGRMGGYGNVVIISHGGGMTTLYAHCSRLLVKAGQKVSRGQTIAKVGSTGLSTGPHLHFEVAINGKKVDPRKYL
jgi:murein DD-endopeptidase MepM/ murein hydrolase activator NlpD